MHCHRPPTTIRGATRVLAPQHGHRAKVSASVRDIFIVTLGTFVEQDVLAGAVAELDHILLQQLHKALGLDAPVVDVCSVGRLQVQNVWLDGAA